MFIFFQLKKKTSVKRSFQFFMLKQLLHILYKVIHIFKVQFQLQIQSILLTLFTIIILFGFFFLVCSAIFKAHFMKNSKTLFNFIYMMYSTVLWSFHKFSLSLISIGFPDYSLFYLSLYFKSNSFHNQWYIDTFHTIFIKQTVVWNVSILSICISMESINVWKFYERNLNKETTSFNLIAIGIKQKKWLEITHKIIF